MSQQPHQQVVRIATTTAVPLSKNQKTFNRLTSRIGEQAGEWALLQQTAEKTRRRIQTDLLPLQAELDKLRAKMVYLFDRACTMGSYASPERKKLVYLITDMAYDLIQQGFDELKPIYDRYSDNSFDEVLAELKAYDALMVKRMAELKYGIQFELDADISTPEKLNAYIATQLQAQREATEQQKRDEATQWAGRPKSARQQARAAKKEAEVQKMTKAVRAMYMDLVKAFHPDLELDETEKIRKTAIMQRVTEAYEKSDLLGLFRLQLDFERIDQAHLEKLADTQLTYYNGILQQQVDELDQRIEAVQQELRSLVGGKTPGSISPIGIDYAINHDVRQMKQHIKTLKVDLRALADAGVMNQWLKMYRIPKSID
ncbi:hypothetical protein [Fibrella arboris]|uniref:hypothetical protein n=1 Tax=Fibrella arboris TaxID=3242486 RepID=UPI0035224B4C